MKGNNSAAGNEKNGKSKRRFLGVLSKAKN